MIERKSELLQLEKGLKITVWEAGFGMDTVKGQLEEAARNTKDEDKLLAFFRLETYPLLAALTEDAPSAEEAYKLPREKLDEWYSLVYKLNGDMFVQEYHEPGSEVVTFRDGSTLTIHEMLGRPSHLLRMAELEIDAIDNPIEGAEAVMFQRRFYPRLAAASSGNIPNVREAANYPRSEINKWLVAVMNQNPNLFRALNDAARREEEKEDTKKKD